MKLYTRTGDKGTSSLYNGDRVAKSNIYFKFVVKHNDDMDIYFT